MESKVFKALVISEKADGRYERRIMERSVGELPAGDVLIQVRYSSLNYKDALSSSGNKGVTRRYPHTPGIDAAGIVAESAVPEFRAGDEVLACNYDIGMNKPGGFGQYIRVPAKWVMRLTEGLTLRESMMIGTAGFTAAQCVQRLLAQGLAPAAGKILVTGATGGVGSIGVAILAREGYQVAAVTGKPEAAPFLETLGAAEIIARSRAADTSGKMLLKGKWAGVVDTVGGDILATAIKSTRYGGVVTCCGNAASAELPLNVYPFILRGISLHGIDSAECPMRVREQVWQKLANEWKLPVFAELSHEIPLADLSRAIDEMLAGRVRGRVIVNLFG